MNILRLICVLTLVFVVVARGQDPSPAPSPDASMAPPPDAPLPAMPATPRDTSLIEEAKRQQHTEAFSRRELGFDERRLDAINSVRVTLEYSPQILIQDTDVRSREGATRNAQGEFDTHVTGRAQADLKERRRNLFARPSPTPPPTPSPRAASSGLIPGLLSPVLPSPRVAAPTPTPYPNPLVHRTSLYEFELGLSQKLRNGIVLEPKVAFRPSVDADYNNNFTNTNEGSVSFGVFIPLAKGGGRLVNEAPELAARFDLLASVHQLRFVTAQAVRDTMLAYWRCRAAEERCKLSAESEAISLRLIKMSVALVEADELAPAQLAQILADRNTTTAARISSEAALILARQRLAIAMGYNPDALVMAPLTADPFPTPPRNQDYPDINELWLAALNLRDDLRASRQLEKSRKTLMDASYLELRPRIDLQLRATQMVFETRATTTITEGMESGVFAALSMDWPIQNNSALGAHIQSTAAYDRSLVDTENTKRTIVSGVISAMAELRSADAEFKRYSEAVRLNEKALAAQEDLFRLGQANLTDTITARQRLIQSQMDAIGAQERYATGIVQLRFETGLLFFSDAQGDWIDAQAWQTVPLLNTGKKR